MRLRNLKNSSDIIENSSYVINDYKNYKCKFNTVFNNNNPIHVEIGMGKGNFILEMAQKYPSINFIGIEKFDNVLARALKKMPDNVPNLKIIKMDANIVDEVFKNEIEVLYLNFSDPWPKARHESRRLTHINFLKKYDSIFKNKKRIIMKTDNRKLFEYSVISFTNYNYKIEELSLNLYSDELVDNVQTEYEKKFHDLGHPIYKIEVTK